ncbi:MAG: adenylate/guanylate cyclase domain-containing protein [Sneathiella sp.]
MAVAVDRKLTTILCADVCGYSKHMGRDEEGTLSRLKIAREEFAKHISDHAGRIVNMTGDGLVAEFGSVVQAVQCALGVQDFLKEKNSKSKDPDCLIFRIGLNLGDVIIEGDDIFGDGVNVAARLEAMAPPGGICISGTVYDHVKGKFPNNFQYLGKKEVKNIADAVPVYTSGMVDMPETEAPPSTTRPSLDEEEQTIRKEVKRKAAFYRRAVSTGALIVFLFLINVLTTTSYFWFIWPTLPLLFFLALDAVRVFGKGQFAHDWEERQVNHLKARKHRRYGSGDHKPSDE